jgi:hypothetical protein
MDYSDPQAQRAEEKRLVAEAADHAVGLTELTGVVFYVRDADVVVRNPDKLIELLDKLAPKKWEEISKGTPPFPCPNCGSESMSTVDDVLAFRTVRYFSANDKGGGTLITDGMDDYSDGDNTRLSCADCQCDFEIPGGVAVDWED